MGKDGVTPMTGSRFDIDPDQTYDPPGCREAFDRITKTMIDIGAGPDAMRGDGSETLPRYYAGNDNLEMVNTLPEAGADPTIPDGYGRTAESVMENGL